MGLYGNVFSNNIIYNINLESSYNELSNILESVNIEYITEGVNIKEILNKAITKLKELWNKFKTWAKDIIKKLREFINKILKNNKSKEQSKDKEEKDKEQSKYNYKEKYYYIKYYDFKLDGVRVDWESGNISYTAYSTWLLADYYEKYEDIDISELDQWLEEKKNECIEKSDEEFKKFKDKNTISEDSFELIEKYIPLKYFNDYIGFIKNNNKYFNKYIVNANKGLDKLEKEIKENENNIDQLNKDISYYTNITY